ncbi:glycosyltransferase family protein [Sphingobacterium lactis]|uniref:Uncharacterized protein n=1 Tax=Sphingobacterium lactis TaxID=797291 RepID=A0A1H5VPP4_9SPHI|nr:hypothetical protein [Sphingobacterium lactis]SEF89259.1 hypothetical protein SAMN05421877_103196 [Sphingobacterium lactis]
MKKRILIISSVFYPVNSPRSNRTVELAKEFARQGHDVTVYAQLGSYDYSSFEKDNNVKVKNLGKNPFSNFNSDIGQINKQSLITKIGKKLLGRALEFPDIGVLSLVNKALITETKADLPNIDLLITIAVPYPIHWGTAKFREKFPEKLQNTTWVADCGDPYMGNPFVKKPFYFKYVEKWFCRYADFLSIPINDAKDAYYPEFQHKIKIIPQGFEIGNEDYSINFVGNRVPTFIYAGTFYKDKRDPRPLLEYLIKKGVRFKFKIYTKTKHLLLPYIDSLGDCLEINDYLPREQLLVEMSKADFLLNIENNSNLQSPSKLIDYGLVKRPILNIKSNGNLNESIVDEFLEGIYINGIIIDDISEFDIRVVSKRFLDLISNKS